LESTHQNRQGFQFFDLLQTSEWSKSLSDAAWVTWERWSQLTLEQQKKFPPLCPDFVIDLRSQSDALEPLQQKMQEYINNGLRLGWLINPQDRQVEIYKAGQPKQVLQNPNQVDGDDVLPGFVVDLSILWEQ
jgi:Uma2 family endonuclease